MLMLDSTKKYWLYIYPQVYCCIKDKQILLYHTQTGESIETCDRKILELLHSVADTARKNNNSPIGIFKLAAYC